MISPQSDQLLNYLKNAPLLQDYCLSIYSSCTEAAPDKINRHLCGTRGIPHLCHKICLPSLNVAVDDALTSSKSVFFRCPLGLFSFAIPVSANSCLVCSGMRENLFDLYFYRSAQLESLKEKNVIPFEILEQLEKLPDSTEKEVRETMLQTERLIVSFTKREKMQTVDSTTSLQSTFMNVAAAIEKAGSFTKAVALFSETLGILFDIPVVAYVLKDEESSSCSIEVSWGAFSGPSSVASENLPFQGNYVPVKLNVAEVMKLFPGGGNVKAICLPLCDSGVLLGMAVLFDVSLTPLELSLTEILTGKLAEIRKKDQKYRENQRQQRIVRLLEMVRTLALTESQDALLRLILEMAAELVEATNGSLMIIDKSGEILRVASALGIHPVLARSLSSRVGEGIAGSVAVSGTPLLITDIEKDQNIARQNRIRFNSKSCISLPLRIKGATVGVLNLADKKNNTPFTPADQDILSTFTEQATIILERNATLKKAKSNTIIDPMTGLCNMRFIKKRLNEELSRSIRHNLQLGLILIKLDNFTASHEANDRGQAHRVVKKMARILSASFRDIDLVGRSGEAEFCVVLPATPLKEAVFVAERIKRTINKEFINGSDSQLPGCLTTHIGVASFPENGASSGELINAARTALTKDAAAGGLKSAPPIPDLPAK